MDLPKLSVVTIDFTIDTLRLARVTTVITIDTIDHELLHHAEVDAWSRGSLRYRTITVHRA